jgi:hypothetical protein
MQKSSATRRTNLKAFLRRWLRRRWSSLQPRLTAIALPGQDPVSVALRAHCKTLGIRNIRVVKQIERLARRVDELLIECRQTIRDQATHSLTLFGWSKYDRENAPKMEFLRVRVEEDSRRPILPRSPALWVFGSVSLMNLWQAPMLPARMRKSDKTIAAEQAS